MDYAQAVAYLLTFADFERSGRFLDRPDVAPVLALLHTLGDPHLGRRTVHVAGSKGKGSVCAMTESVLRAAGLHTGLYTSPHLHSYCERIRIDGQPLPEADFARLAGELKAAVEATQSRIGERSFVTFDLLTALGFLAFREAGVDVQVIEVGLGGRVDSTNVFETKDVTVITPLSLEHTAVLGDSIEQIVREKAAIIRPGAAVVLAPQEYPEAVSIVREAAGTVRLSPPGLVDVAAEYRWQVLSHDLDRQRIRIERPCGTLEAELPLLGAHQAENAATAVATVDALRSRGVTVSEADIVRGLASVSWPARLEVLSRAPLVIADGAHNRDSARRLAQALCEYFGAERVTFIVGASSGKDIEGLAAELAPLAARVIAAAADHPRAMAPSRIREAFAHLGLPAEEASSVAEALARAMAVSAGGGLICLTGSLFVAAEGRAVMRGPGESVRG